MMDLLLKILALAAFVFVWGCLWSWTSDKEEAEFQADLRARGETK
jgi:hypothetical protein